jgi:hypothetical protein
VKQVDSVVYWVDTCSFTKLRRDYPREQFEPVWLLVENLVGDGRLKSVEEVKVEIDAQDDLIAKWANENRNLFIPLEDDIQEAARQILAKHPTLVDTRKRKGSADPFIIGAATIHGGKVVTEEKHSGGPEKVKIPDVCDALKVDCISMLELLKREGLRSK